MGQYLKRAYEERDLAIALAKVHGLIDENTQKLSDKLENLKLSHKRLETLVKQFVDIFDYYEWYLASPSADRLYDRAVSELNNPLYRCREKKKGVFNERKIGSNK